MSDEQACVLSNPKDHNLRDTCINFPVKHNATPRDTTFQHLHAIYNLSVPVVHPIRTCHPHIFVQAYQSKLSLPLHSVRLILPLLPTHNDPLPKGESVAAGTPR
jgi:hypothetical protein